MENTIPLQLLPRRVCLSPTMDNIIDDKANKNPGKQIIMPKNGKIIFPESDTNDRANPSTAGILKRTFPATCPSV